MRRALATVLGAVLITGVLAEDSMAREIHTPERTAAVALPAPHLDGGAALERALAERRSVREFARGALTLPQVAQLLWPRRG